MATFTVEVADPGELAALAYTAACASAPDAQALVERFMGAVVAEAGTELHRRPDWSRPW